MRIVAGSARGLRIDAPPGRTTRPTTDRVREAVFNALGSLDVVRGAQVVDLFAGSGALGLEALSRGAAHATFVDTDGRALDIIRGNIDRLGVAERATVVRADALGFVGSMAPVDLALCDPPYAFGDWTALLDALVAEVVVVESDREVTLPQRWDATRVRRYGGTLVTVAHRRTPSE